MIIEDRKIIELIGLGACMRHIGQKAAAVEERLPGPEWKMLKALIDVYPMGLSNEEWGAATNYSHKGSSFKNPRGRLTTLEFVERTGDRWKAADLLFLEGT